MGRESDNLRVMKSRDLDPSMASSPIVALHFRSVVVVITAIVLSFGLACGGGGKSTPTQTRSQSASAVAACETRSSEKFIIVPHGKPVSGVIEAVTKALAKAIDGSRAAYGWMPAESVCVHVFSGD